jgi:hypothetical protein
MKTSFIIGWATLFIVGIFLELVITGGTGVGSSYMDTLSSLTKNVNIVNVTSLYSVPVIGQAASLITMIGQYFAILIAMIFLYFPDIWAGNWIWLWYFLCIPVSVGFIFSFITILRGVHSS